MVVGLEPLPMAERLMFATRALTAHLPLEIQDGMKRTKFRFDE